MRETAEAGVNPHRRLGDILVEARIITPEQCETVRREQERTGGRFGDILVRLGFVSETVIVLALSEQLALPFVSESRLSPDPRVAEQFPAEEVWGLRMLPLSESESEVVVAVTDPLDGRIPEVVAERTGKRARLVLSMRSALERVLGEVYGAKDELTRLRAENSALRQENAALRALVEAYRGRMEAARELLDNAGA